MGKCWFAGIDERNDVPMSVYEDLKALLEKELGYLPSGPGLDMLLSRGTVEDFSRGDVVIEKGNRCSDVFIIKSGIARFVDFDGDRERTFAFALPGTIFASKHSFVMGLPSYYQVEACCDSEFLRIDMKSFWEVMECDHQVALWMLRYAYGELFYQEHKNAVVHNGSASDRYRSMLGDRPEIIEKVSQKIIASYLGVTPEYLSKLKREFLKGK